LNKKEKLSKGWSNTVRSSLFVRGIGNAVDWLSRQMSEGFFGTLFHSFRKTERLFNSGVCSVIGRRRRGKDTPLKRMRRRVSGIFENSFVLKCFGKLVEYLLSCSLRVYGAFSIIFGLYTVLLFCIKSFMLDMNADIFDLIFGVVVVIVSIPLLYSNRQLAESLRDGRISRFILFRVLLIPETKLSLPENGVVRRYNWAVIGGMIAGFLTYFVSPVLVLGAIFAVVACSIILCQPEAGILGLIIFAPFTSLLPHPTFVVLTGVVVTGFAYLIKCIRGKRTMRFGLMGYFVALFALVTFLGGFSATGGKESFYPAVTYVVLMLGYFLTVNLLGTRELCHHALISLGVSSSIVAAYGVLQYVLGDVTANWLDNEMFSYIPGRATSFFDNPNVLGTYLIMMIPFILAIFICVKGFKAKGVLFAELTLTILCLIWTWSRGAWLGGIVGLFALLVVLNSKNLIILLAAGLCAPLMKYFVPGGVISRFASIGNMADSSTYYRVYTWKGVIRMLKDVWPSGIGVGQAVFEQMYPSFAYAGIEAAPHAHNLIMQITVELGITGTVIFVLLMFFFFQNCLEFIKNSSGESRLLVGAGMSGIAAALVMGLFDHIWYNYRVFFIFWVVVGLTVSYISSCRMERDVDNAKMNKDFAEIDVVILD